MSPEISDLFSKVDSGKSTYMKTKKIGEHKKEMGPRVIRLSRGVVPDYVKLSKYQEFCWRTIGKIVHLRAKPNPRQESLLLQAHMRMRQEEFVAYVWMTTLLVGIIGALISVFFGTIFIAVLNISPALAIFFSVLVVVIPTLMTYVLINGTPGSKAKARKRDIDKRIGPAMSFISAMASADVNIDVIFKELSRQPIYGEIQKESEWITRDTELLGIDILTAISKAAQRTPSQRFQEFLQGVVTTSTSGGQLKPYFLQKAEQFEKEHKLEIRGQLETLGLMAESFVTVVVAFTLFLIVIMAIMAIVPGGGGSASTTITLLYAVVGLMVPLSQFGFIFFIWNITKESTM